jgi:hypothetical protein
MAPAHQRYGRLVEQSWKRQPKPCASCRPQLRNLSDASLSGWVDVSSTPEAMVPREASVSHAYSALVSRSLYVLEYSACNLFFQRHVFPLACNHGDTGRGMHREQPRTLDEFSRLSLAKPRRHFLSWTTAAAYGETNGANCTAEHFLWRWICHLTCE